MNKISFFTPITNHPNNIFSFSENYFNFGTTTAKFLRSGDETNYVKLETTPWTYTSMAATALKVALVFTLLLPLTAALFAVKISYRLQHHFTLETDTSPHKVLKQKESDLTEATHSIDRLNWEIGALRRGRAQLFQEITHKDNALAALSEELIRAQKTHLDLQDRIAKLEQQKGSPSPHLLQLEGDFVKVDPTSDPFEMALQDYLVKYCPGITPERALAKIVAGERFFKRILSEPKELLEECRQLNTEGQKEQISSLVWYFMARAIKKNKPFHEGTFVTDYLPEKLYDFLRQYPGAYSRQQSHFKDRVPKKGYGYGIDFNEGPAQKTHLLFEIIDEGKRLFIKPENYGVQTWSDTLFHGAEFLESLGRHAGLGSNQAEGMRKERVDPDWIHDFKNFICSEKERVIKEAQNWGLNYIRTYLDAYQAALKTFLNEFETHPEILISFASLVPESSEKTIILSRAEVEGLPYIRAYLSEKLHQVDEVLKRLPKPDYAGHTGHEVYFGNSMTLDPSLLGLNP